MVRTPWIGASFSGVDRPRRNDATLGVVGLLDLPHLDALPTNTMANAERCGRRHRVPAYAIDRTDAIKVSKAARGGLRRGQWRSWVLAAPSRWRAGRHIQPDLPALMG